MMDYSKEYDETNPISIEKFAQKLIGRTFADVCKQDDITKASLLETRQIMKQNTKIKKEKAVWEN